MTKSRLFSGKIKKLYGDKLTVDRYNYLDPSQAEPDLGQPSNEGSVLTGSTITNVRSWSNILTVSSSSVYVGSTLTNVGFNTPNALIVVGGVSVGGDVNISGKAYINSVEVLTTQSGLTSQFGQSVINLILKITTSTNSTSTNSGALIVTGGVGIGKDVWIGGTTFAGNIYTNGYLVGSSTGTTSSFLINNFTESTSTNSGALVVNGGVGIGGALFVNTTSYVAGSQIITTATINQYANQTVIYAGTDTAVSTSTGNITIWNTSTLQTITDRGNSTTNRILIANTTTSTSSLTGALQVLGGVGIGGNLYVGGLLYADRLSINDTQSLTNLIPIEAGPDISVNTNTGIIVVSNISTLQSVTGRGATTNNSISITNTSSSTSGVTGALRVSGGVGVGGNIYAAGNINAGGVRTISSSSAPTTPTPTIGDIWYNTTNDRLYRFTSNSIITFWLDYTGPKIATQANPIVQILAPIAVPGPPTITTATIVNSSQVSVTYVAANYDGGTPITAYTARVYTSSGSGVGITQTVNTNIGGTILVSNLSSSTTYTFVVYATNIIGDSINSNVSNSVTTPAQSPVNLIGPTITGTASINQTLTVNSNGTWSPGDVTFTYQWQRGTGNSPYSFSNIFGATNNSYLLVDADGLLVIKCIITGNNAGGAVPASSNISSAIQPGVPGAPTIGTPIQTGGTTANVPFTVPTTTGGAPIIKYVATAYAYPAGTDTGIYNELLVENLSSPTTGIVNMTGLTFNTSYTFKVTAVNIAGVGPLSNSSIVITTGSTTPFAPIIGTATATGQTTANVTFTSPTSNGGAAITSYIIVSNPTGGIGSVNQSIGGTIAVTALSTNTNYTFTVSAQNVNGFGPASTSSNSILTFAGVPNVPTGVTATATGQTTANVVFVAPANNGGSTITSYTATSSPADGTGTLTQSGSGTISVTGLYANTNYTFTVTAANSIGTSNPSNPSASILTNPGLPGIPTGVTATATGQTTINVQFTPPANNGGTAITSYYALSDVGGISSTINSSSPGWNTSTFFITGLATQSPYKFRVQATNSVGTGSYSNYSNTATTLAPIPTIISTPTTYMVNAAPLAVGNSIAVVLPGGSWGNSPTSYTYQWTRNKSIIRGGNGVTTAISGATSSTYLIVTADAYSVLNIVVTAYNSGGNASSASSNNSDVPAVAPTAVILGTAIKTGITTASVPFTPPVDNGGPAIVSYTLTSENGGITQTLTQAGGGTFYVTGLTVATQYRFKIICSNGFYVSPDSGWTNYITTDKDLPNPPTSLTVSTVSNTAISVGYSAPIYTGGTTITSYTAVSTPGGLTGNISTSGSGSIVVNGLDSGTSYTFNAYATNEIGNSTLSTASNSIFTLPTVPNAPTIGTATYGSTNTSIIVSYTAPAYNGGVGDTGLGQIITYTAISTPDGITGTTSTYLSGSITINGLVYNRSYTFKVRATNSVGVGSYSNDSNAIVPWGLLAGPLAPTLISVTTASVSSITVQYAEPGLAIPVGTTATGFIVTASPTNANNTVTYTTSTLGSASLTIPGLSTSTTYNVKVNALSNYGIGLDSNVLSISLGAGVPPAPTLLSVTSGTTAVLTATYTIPTIPSYISSLTGVILTAVRTTVTNPTTLSLEMLVIGGGGAGGTAGGGGGGFVETTATINMDTINYITVGAGGSAATWDARGENGQNSSFTSTNNSIIAYGGGSGGRKNEPFQVGAIPYNWYYRSNPSQGARRTTPVASQSWSTDGGSGGSGGGAGADWGSNQADGVGGYGNSQYSGTRLYDTTGAQRNRNWVTATHIAQTSTAVQGYNGGSNPAYTTGATAAAQAGAGGGGAGGVGSDFVYSGNPSGSQNGAAGGHGRVSTMISTTASNTYGIGTIYNGSVYFGGGGGGAGAHNQDAGSSSPNPALGGAGGRGGGGRGAEPNPAIVNSIRALAQFQQNITPGTNGAGGGGGGVAEFNGNNSIDCYQTAGGRGAVVIRHLTTVTNWKINVSGSASANGYVEGLYTYYVWTSSGTIQYTRGDSTITTSTTSTISGSITANVNTGSTYNVSVAAINAAGSSFSNAINIAV